MRRETDLARRTLARSNESPESAQVRRETNSARMALARTNTETTRRQNLLQKAGNYHRVIIII